MAVSKPSENFRKQLKEKLMDEFSKFIDSKLNEIQKELVANIAGSSHRIENLPDIKIDSAFKGMEFELKIFIPDTRPDIKYPAPIVHKDVRVNLPFINKEVTTELQMFEVFNYYGYY